MKDRSALARGWFRKADSDLADARRTAASEGPYDTACFHAQQAVEKYLKGVLAWRSLEIPRTHDLEELQRLCSQLEPWPELATCDLTDLTAYAVELRYDAEFWPPPPTPSSWLSKCAPACSLICRRTPDRKASLRADRRPQPSQSAFEGRNRVTYENGCTIGAEVECRLDGPWSGCSSGAHSHGREGTTLNQEVQPFSFNQVLHPNT